MAMKNSMQRMVAKYESLNRINRNVPIARINTEMIVESKTVTSNKNNDIKGFTIGESEIGGNDFIG